MAKRRKKARATRRRTRTKTVTRYRTRSPARRTRRRGGRHHSGGGMLGGILPNKQQMYDIAGAGVYGFLEGKAKKDDSFILNKIASASPIKQLGMAGNVALAARLVGKFAFKHPAVYHFAQGAACVAIYQMARQGALFADTKPFTVSGDDDLGSDDDIAGEIDGDTMGALAADADAADLEGYDDESVGDMEEMMGEDDA